MYYQPPLGWVNEWNVYVAVSLKSKIRLPVSKRIINTKLI